MLNDSQDKFKKYIDVLVKCSQACFECFGLSLKEREEDLQSRSKCIKLLIECAIMCQTSAAVMAMDAKNAELHCIISAQACIACADECEKIAETHYTECAKICLECADVCANAICF